MGKKNMGVDNAVRMLTEACTDDFAKKDVFYKQTFISKFMAIDDSEKPKAFRNKSKKQTEERILNLNAKLKEILSKICLYSEIIEIKQDSNDNKIGGDIIVTLLYSSRTEKKVVELKFGSKTDRNIGLGTFDMVFPVLNQKNYFQNKIASIKRGQRKCVDEHNGNIEVAIKNLQNQLEDWKKELNEMIENGSIAINSDMMYKVLSTTGSVVNNTEAEIFKAVKITFKRMREIEILDCSGSWKITDIVTSSKTDVARIHFIASNGKNKVRFTLNNKNNDEYKGNKYPSKSGIGSYSFNVWISKEK